MLRYPMLHLLRQVLTLGQLICFNDPIRILPGGAEYITKRLRSCKPSSKKSRTYWKAQERRIINDCNKILKDGMTSREVTPEMAGNRSDWKWKTRPTST